MKKVILLLSVVLWTIPASSQVLSLPRDSQRLISRAQTYWKFLTAGQKTKALDLVLPDKREAFLATTPMALISAKVESLNLTSDLQHGSVQVQLQLLIPGGVGKDNLTFTQYWVWTNNNWYSDVGEAKGFPMPNGLGKTADILDIEKSIDQHLTLPETTLNIGTVTQGKQLRLEVPIAYSGTDPLTAELATPYPAFSIGSDIGSITSESKHFILTFDTAGWENALAVPLKIRFRYQTATVDRTLTVQGDVFVPIAFRQVPPEVSADRKDPISVFIRNNTASPIQVSTSTEGKIDILKTVQMLVPGQETELVVRLKPHETADLIYLFPDKPVDGVAEFTYRLHIGH